MSTLRIAVIGGGLGGLAAARALIQAGAHVQVFEQAKQFMRVGAGIQMPPNAMKVLRAIGAEKSLCELGLEPETNLNVKHDTGEVMNDLPLAGVMRERYGAPFLCVHRADLHAALFSVLSLDTVRFGAKLADITQDAEGVTVSLVDGAPETFDAAIGADGIHSIVRQRLFGEDSVTYTGRVAYRATYPASRLDGFSFAKSRIKWWGPERHVVMYYTRRALDEVYVQTVQADTGEWITRESWSMKGDLELVRQVFSDFHPDVRRVLDACESVHKWAIQYRDPMPTWSVGRITLLGDACHAMLQHKGQGGAQALEDAVVLARCLDGTPASGIERALQRYEATRRERTSKIQLLAAQNTWMRGATNPDWVYGYDALTVPIES